MPSRPVAPVRPATRADLDALVALEAACFTGDRISRRQWLRHVTGGGASVLVAVDSEAVQAAAVVLYRRDSQAARLYSIAVHPALRGSGLGAALLAAAERAAQARACTAMRLEVRVGNTAAIALYESRGYQYQSRLPGYYEDGSDAWRYAKPLRQDHAAASAPA